MLVLFEQNKDQIAKITENYDLSLIQKTIQKTSLKENLEREKAILYAKENNLPLTRDLENGGFEEVYKVLPNGQLIYQQNFTESGMYHFPGGLTSGVHLLQAINGNQQQTIKVFVK